jgi:hypothetical protein
MLYLTRIDVIVGKTIITVNRIAKMGHSEIN